MSAGSDTVSYAEAMAILGANDLVMRNLKRGGLLPEPLDFETRDGTVAGRWSREAIEALRDYLDADTQAGESPLQPADPMSLPVRPLRYTSYVAEDVAELLGISGKDFDALRAAGRFPEPTHRCEGYAGTLEVAWDFPTQDHARQAVLPARQQAAPQPEAATTKQAAPKTSNPAKPRQPKTKPAAPATGGRRLDPRRD